MSSTADSIVANLRRMKAQREVAEKMGTIDKVIALQDWQCNRLLDTHSELAEQRQYQPAMTFFIEELYGPKDFSQRDADLARVVPKLAALLPEKAMLALRDAVAVNALSFELDLDLADKVEGQLNSYSYAMAYRKCDRKMDRQKQLNTIYHLGEQLSEVVRIRGVSLLIRLAKKPAQLAGLLSLHEFLERGFSAFKEIGDVHSFIDPVITKEREIMTILHDQSHCLKTHNPLSKG